MVEVILRKKRSEYIGNYAKHKQEIIQKNDGSSPKKNEGHPRPNNVEK